MLKAIGDVVLLKARRASETTPGRDGKPILLPRESQLSNPWEQELEVVDIGPRAETDLSPGDRVVLRVYTGLKNVRTFKHEGDEYVSIHPNCIMGRVDSAACARVTVDGRGRW
jgi:co-chaperonin GroES (HSP10)